MTAAARVVRALRGGGLPGGVPHHEWLAGDALLAAGLFAAEALAGLLAPQPLHARSWPAALAWSAAGAVAVALRRRRTWAAVWIVAGQAVAGFADPAGTGHTGVAAVVVIGYTAAVSLPLRQSVTATVLMWLPGLAITLATGSSRMPAGLGPAYSSRMPAGPGPAYAATVTVLTALVCFLAGRTVHNRRAVVAALAEQARTTEATQRALTARAVADERRRIARELHDVVAHHVSVMGVLATGSRRALAREPATADDALATIEQTGRTVLREMRRILDVLRADDGASDDGLIPQPGLAEIAGLVAQVREAGLAVRFVAGPDLDGLDPGVALTVYRIVQEALTNVIKHAEAPDAEVRLTIAGRALVLEVSDTGHGPPPGHPLNGHGLLGMRERVALYGGTLRVGPRPGGGFRVCARIPVEPSGGTAGPTKETAP